MGQAHTTLSNSQLNASKELLKSKPNEDLIATTVQPVQKAQPDNLRDAREDDSPCPLPCSSEGQQMSIKNDEAYSAGSLGHGKLGGEAGVVKREKKKFGDDPLHWLSV